MDSAAAPAPEPDAPARGDRYTERLSVPWWWWPIAAAIVALLGYEAQLAAYRQTWSFVFYPVFALIVAWLLVSMGRVRLRVDADGTLHAHTAMLPREVIARGAVIPKSARSAAMGRQLDPAAFLVYKSWVETMVLLVLDDPDDPTPYWLVSTRNPGELLAALGLEDAAAQQEPTPPQE
ncbi:DUF3093 domain-containing protein [Gordonia sp. VNK21]|uniref:DUF3093 domain-containing protein n=1 Tax=Gordonia sp. VNK21 TaxID=3382483 RepID=UPI0038D3618B